MNWMFTYQGNDLVTVDNEYYEWDEAYSQYKKLNEGVFSAGDPAEEQAAGKYYGKEDEFQNLQHLSSTTPTPPGTDTTTIGEQDFGMEGFTKEKYEGMTPDKLADYIFKMKYGEKAPGDWSDNPYGFKEEIKRLAALTAPKIEEIDQTQVSFLAEQYGGEIGVPTSPYDLTNDGVVNVQDVIAANNEGNTDQAKIIQDIVQSGKTEETFETSYNKIGFEDSLIGRKAVKQKESDIYGLQKGAKTLGKKTQNIYSGMGQRGGTEVLEDLSKGFSSIQDTYDLTKDIAEFDYKKGMYELEQKQTSKWENQFQQFIAGLPQAGGT
tara:strand:- start:3119 stop:4084 length:966 start_codon:yes stop_codon:yes gene_type:complete